jgi:hypothetical protein
MSGYDGSIRINTKLDTGDLSKDMDKVGNSIKAPLGSFGAKLKSVGVAMAGVGIALAGAFSVSAITNFVKSAADSFSWLSSSYAPTLRALSVSSMRLEGIVANLFDTILATFGPYIIDAIQWLITKLTDLAQIVQAVGMVFFGLGDSKKQIKAATDAEGRLTKETNRLGDAAKGALASFDELHVLNAKPAIPEVAAPPSDVIDKVKGIKDIIDSFADGSIWGNLWSSFTKMATEIWTNFPKWAAEAWANVQVWAGIAWENIKKWGAEAWTNIQKWGSDAWAGIQKIGAELWGNMPQWVKDAWAWVEKTWGQISEWFDKNVISPVAEKFGGLVETVKQFGDKMYSGFIKPIVDWFVNTLWPTIQQVFGYLESQSGNVAGTLESVGNFIVQVFQGAFDTVVLILQEVFRTIGDIVGGIIDAIGGIVKFITGIFTGDWQLAWEGVKQIFSGIWDAIGGIVRGVMNIIIDVVNTLMRAVASAINFVIGGLNSLSFDVPDWVPGIGGQRWGFNIQTVTAPQIPRLATGAVIPPNAAFAAILGDQTSGTNIEAPESLIRQIIQEEMGKVQTEVTINFAGSLAALVRELKPYIDDENTRVGASLIEGIA